MPDYRQWVGQYVYGLPGNRGYDLTARIVDLLPWPDDDDDHDARLSHALDRRWADARAAAAVALSLGGHDRAAERLHGLLRDTDCIVRRLAADALFGGDASLQELSERYDFKNVLAAEKQASRLCELIRHGDHLMQYETTRKLMALGRPAVWALHLLSHDSDREVSLSATYALQEIEAVDTGPPPLWFEQMKAAKRRKVSFAFSEVSLAEALTELQRLSGTPIVLEDIPGRRTRPIALRLEDRELGFAVAWVASLDDCGCFIRRRGIVVQPRMKIWHDVLPYWVDVRGLNLEWDAKKWENDLNRNVASWVGIPELATWTELHHGMLMVMVRCDLSDDPNMSREKFQPILDYVESLRLGQTPEAGEGR